MLITDGDGDTLIHPRWRDRWSPDIALADEWVYLSGRVLSGQGGNLVSYEVAGFEARTYAAVEDAVEALEAQLTASSRGPFGRLRHLSGDPICESENPPTSAPKAPPHLTLVKS